MPLRAQLLYVMGPLPLQMAMRFPAVQVIRICHEEAEGGKQAQWGLSHLVDIRSSHW